MLPVAMRRFTRRKAFSTSASVTGTASDAADDANPRVAEAAAAAVAGVWEEGRGVGGGGPRADIGAGVAP
eukprot:CAMPEP_0197582894 /NCGR_PEP_ID=MMETSP1326-20131121/5984_1 /TAXON_ID=1155430 /ORGANISM="Genus nov. species nov., Strain RCC2288" /LENGTH=69 /DNA_ID=CAMNT_0043147041 /DNA_START=83 /DNA_END=289 /DNA_ORIENTATION=-